MKDVKMSEVLMKRYPKAAKHYLEWEEKYRYGENPARSWGRNPLWLLEDLCRGMNLKKGMRVLDMTNNDVSSIFLAKEFGVQVWSVSGVPSLKLVQETGVEKLVYPIKVDTTYMYQTPFADEFFDAIISIDQYHNYGTSDSYLYGLQKIVKKDGRIGIVVPGLTTEIGIENEKEYSEDLIKYLCLYSNSFHTAGWWKNHWEKSHLVKVEVADYIKECEEIWMDTNYRAEEEMLPSVEEGILTFVKMNAKRV